MRTNKLIGVVTVAAFLAACGGNSAKRSGHEYEVVQEGSASGVTSTIQGPGETLPPITGTNSDTTTAFTINPNAVPPATAPATPGSIAGTLPPPAMPSATPVPPPMT